ncbi:PAS domain S-box protein [Halobacteria archaeon AArc-curdl1]|uniref:PAS domain S-box protein n=1 Tax=Natronosalvus hydrolyticus TaxID=2979988 RepID=A0AAP2Z5Z5_9EURY|nr:PAS domain S-box protein [Halobacteria archaeon AArc-curdl1]
MGNPIRVLHVQTETEFAGRVSTSLEQAHETLTVETAGSVEEGLSAVSERDIHCVLSAADLSERNGLELCTEIHRKYQPVPFILYTKNGSKQLLRDAVSANVSECVPRHRLLEAPERITAVIEEAVVQSRQQREKQYLLDALESANEGISIVDDSGEFVYVNDAYADLFRDEPATMIGESWGQVYPEADIEEPHESILSTVEANGDWQGETTGLRADGTTFVAAKTITKTKDGYVCTVQDVSEAKQRKRRFEAIFNNTYTFVGLMEPDGTLIEANEAALSFGGLDREAVVERPLWETYWFRGNEATQRAARAAVQQARNGTMYRDEITVQGADREIIIDFSVRPVTNDEGEVTLLIPEGRNINERKQYLRQLETLVDNLPGIAYRGSNERGWPMEKVGGEVEALTGYTATELTSNRGLYGKELIHEADRDMVWETVQEALDRRESFELTYRIRAKDGETKWVWEKGQGIYSSAGEIEAIEGFITDITERKRITDELREERVFIDQAIDALEDVFYVFDRDGEIRRWNSKLSSVTGYSDDEIDEMAVADFVPTNEQERILSTFSETLETGSAVIESALCTADGDSIPYEFTGARLTDSEGTTDGLVGVGRDITERRRYEVMLKTLHERTREMTRADQTDTIAEIAVEATDDLLDLEQAVVFEFDGGNSLVPLAGPTPLDGTQSDRPVVDTNGSDLWEAFADGESRFLEETEGTVLQTLSIETALVLPVANHGVFVIGSADELSLDRTQREFAHLMKENLAAAFDHAKRERDLGRRDRQLRRQNESLEQLNRLNELIRDINQALIRSASRSQISERVCKGLSGADEYAFAWLCTRDTAGEGFEPVAWSGVDSEYIAHLEETVPGTPLADLIDRAFRSGDSVIAKQVLEQPEWEVYRRDALNQGFRAVAAIPIVKNGRTDGVIVIHAKADEIFDDEEVRVLEELGETIGYAFGNVERLHGLQTNEHTEIELAITDERLFTNRLAQELNATVEFVGTVDAESDAARVFLQIQEFDGDAITDQLSELEAVSESRQLFAEDGMHLYYLTIATPQLFSIVQGDGRIQSLESDGTTTTCTIALIQTVDVRSIIEHLQRAYSQTELVARREKEVPVGTRETFREQLLNELTEKQFEALQSAYYGGGYEWPRRSTNEELAATKDIAPSTFQYHLRAAERKILSMILSPS